MMFAIPMSHIAALEQDNKQVLHLLIHVMHASLAPANFHMQ